LDETKQQMGKLQAQVGFNRISEQESILKVILQFKSKYEL